MVKRKPTVGGLIGHLASVSHYRYTTTAAARRITMCACTYVRQCVCLPPCSFFTEYDPRFSVAPLYCRTRQRPRNERYAGPPARTFTFITNDTTMGSGPEQLVHDCR